MKYIKKFNEGFLDSLEAAVKGKSNNGKLIEEMLDRGTHIIGENTEIISTPLIYGIKTKLLLSVNLFTTNIS